MITTTYPPHLLDPGRLCTCLHRYNAHGPDQRYPFDGENPTASPHAGPCAKCLCGKFEDRVAWRVGVSPGRRWSVLTPAGKQVWTAPTQLAAYELARAYTTIDELLARVARLESNAWGAEVRLRQAARRPVKPRVRGLEVVGTR